MNDFKTFIFVGLIPLCLLFLHECEILQKNQDSKERKTMMDINEVIRTYADTMLSYPGVQGLYVGETEEGAACIWVMVKEMTPELEEQIPDSLEGYPVRIEESGEIRPFKQE